MSYQFNSRTQTEAKFLSLLDMPGVAVHWKGFTLSPKLIGFEKLNGEVVARIRNEASGRTIVMAIDSFGQLTPRLTFDEDPS